MVWAALAGTWIVVGVLVALVFWLVIGRAETESAHRAYLIQQNSQYQAERRELLKHLFAATSPQASGNLAALNRVERASPDAELADLVRESRDAARLRDNGIIPVGME